MVLFLDWNTFQFLDPVGEEHSVEMVHFVLDDTCGETREEDGLWTKRCIDVGYLDPLPSLYISALPRDAQASFIVALGIVGMFDDLGIDHTDGPIVFVVTIAHETDTDDAFIDTNLRCRETDSAIVWVFDIAHHLFSETYVFFHLGRRDIFALGSQNLIGFTCLYKKMHNNTT